MIWNIGFLVLFLYTARIILADPVLNEREKSNWKYDVSSPVMKMTSSIPLNGTVMWKQFLFLQKHPRNFDVAFAVGPKKVIVKAPSLILSSASPVFERELESRWENAVSEEEEGIPLPDLDPEAFKLFVELTILDSWSVEALEALELPSNQLLHLMSICHKYGMTTALENLTELAQDFLRDFGTVLKPEDFLLLSQAQLETILGSNELEVNESDVFAYAYRWAEEQCRKQDLRVTGENLRRVLGTALYQIRFPAMPIDEFAKVIQLTGILSLEEVAEIVQFIAVGNNDSISNGTIKPKFRVEKRRENSIATTPAYTSSTTPASTSTSTQVATITENPIPPELAGYSILSVTQLYPVIDDPFVCDGRQKEVNLMLDKKTTIYAVGFVGPIDADAFYNVTVLININHGRDVTAKMEKRIFAEKSKTFYFIFDEPAVLYPQEYAGLSTRHNILFTLQGPNTRSLRQYESYVRTIYDGSNAFVVAWHHAQLVEIVYSVDTTTTSEEEEETETESTLPSELAGYSTLSVTQIYPVIDVPFVCDGSQKEVSLTLDKRITMYAVGFVGPIDADAFYNVTVLIKINFGRAVTAKMEKRIFAQKSKTFYFIFDQPAILDPEEYDKRSSTRHYILYTLKGPNTRSLRQHEAYVKTIYDGINEFVVAWHHAQLVEIIYSIDTITTNPLPSELAGYSQLSLTKIYPVVDTPFVCDGSENSVSLRLERKITLRALGFLGPIDTDSFYNVTVEHPNDVLANEEKRIFAQKSKTFYFIFDQPVVLEPKHDNGSNKRYYISFTLKGPNTRSLQHERGVVKRIHDDSQEFQLAWFDPQLVELVYDYDAVHSGAEF